jgi:hypothetical protein
MNCYRFLFSGILYRKLKRFETFEKCSILFKAKEGENFNHPREIGFAFHGAGTNTLSILRINPPKFGGGLKFEPDAGIGQKGAFCKGFNFISKRR